MTPLGEVLGDLPELVENERLARLPRYELPEERPFITAARLAEALTEHGARAHHASGSLGSGAAWVARALVERGRRVLVLTVDADAAQRVRDDLTFFLGPERKVLLFLHNETSPFADVNPDRRAAQLRLATLSHLARGLPYDALVMPLAALARRVVPRDVLDLHSEVVGVDQEIDREALTQRLGVAGYQRAPLVEDPGTFSVRGGLVDVWSPTMPEPRRIELLGDGVLSIKRFDPETQRTLPGEEREAFLALARDTPMSSEALARARERVRALCDAADMPSAKARALVEDVASGRSFFGSDGFAPAFVDSAPLSEYLEDSTPALLEDPSSALNALRAELEARRLEHDGHCGVRFPFEAFYRDTEEVLTDLIQRPVGALHRAATTGAASTAEEALELAPEDTPSLAHSDLSELGRAMKEARAQGKHAALEPLLDRLKSFAQHGFGVAVVARAETQLDRVAGLLRHRHLSVEELDPAGLARWLAAPRPGSLHLARGALARGLISPADRLVLITDEEIFGSRAQRRSPKREGGERAGGNKAKAFIEDLKSLSVGDFVVHVEHGVGRYLGLIHRDVGGTRVDFVGIEYAAGDKLFLPVYRLNQVQKFAGGDAAPKLDRLGGQTFAKTKARAAREVRQMADELLRLYAERRAVKREPLPPADDEYRAFEATFPFEETTDQARAISEVERDLGEPSPMDRLVCGDVGFGKTEVAIRAAFRAAASGRQVAVLCPTTVLAQQHYQNFANRMASYPLEVRSLSRFLSKAEQEDVVRRVKAGSVDIVIGTHRLLSKDIHWKRLGLLVVDEEQRFGVAHKERIKQLRSAIDVLTLSATPIPRTLQMAVSGLREMSVITTPPVDRRAIRTIVTRDDPAVLREAISRELDRGGQVFYVYNRIEGLYERAARIQELLPKARVAALHGQLSEALLERTMLDFVEGAYDVLCATAIIESGLDIPRANTIIIDRADMFGLSQLYQLRGRVGRSRERAYCYLVVPPQDAISDEARSRVEAIERHTELGSGFHVASLDMELRGSGDLLGADQSGTVSAIGFELFCHMLEEAVADLRGQPLKRDIEPELSVDDEALLPDEYIDDVGVRLSLYKRFATADSDFEIDDLAAEMEDRFGPAPDAARRFVTLMHLKAELRRLRILGCEATARGVTLHLAEDTPIDVERLLVLVSSRRSPFKITPDMRITRRFAEGDGPRSGLEAADRALSELASCLSSAGGENASAAAPARAAGKPAPRRN